MSLLAAAGAARAQCEVGWIFNESLDEDQDHFGYCVAIDGDVIVAGAPNAGNSVADFGRAFVFRPHDKGFNHMQQQVLHAWDSSVDGDLDGYSVAIEGHVIAVGARHVYHKGQRPGAVYVWREDPAMEWFWPEQKLIASDWFSEMEFGHAVDISGHLIAASAPRDDDHGSESGSVYAFRHEGTSWLQEAKLLAPDGAAGDRLGSALSVEGDRIVVGARGDDDKGTDSGSVYVFHRDMAGWAQEAKLLASDGGPQDQFGFSVDLWGDTILVGAFRDDERGYDAGAVYVFRYDGATWVQAQKLLPSDGHALEHFGVSVAVEGPTALVGAHWDDEQGSGSGSVYVFRHDPKSALWLQSTKLLGSFGQPWAEFGISVAISGDDAVVGSWLWGAYGYDRGLGYVFSGMLGLDCNDNGTPDACDIFGGTSQDSDADGIPDECCIWDLDGSGAVAVADMLSLLALWGTNPGGPPDFDGNGDVGITDFLTLLIHWGACS